MTSRMMTSSMRFLLAGAASLVLLSSCVQKMGKDGHLRTYEAARTPPANTIAIGQPFQTPQRPDKIPMPITQALLKRGRERFNIYCSPCHDFTGSGDGMIVRRGFLAPPSYHTDRLRNAPDSHFYDVITNGYGAMYSYADRVSENDRWAITAYIRALQLSQNVPLNTNGKNLTPSELKQIQEAKQ